MDINSNEYYVWLYSIIDSCKHDFHFDCARKLLELYKERGASEPKLLELEELLLKKDAIEHAVIR